MEKRPIRCLKIFNGCGSLCIEVLHQEMVLRRSRKPNGRSGYLYYYSCPKCGMEWIQDTVNREIHPISDGYLEKLKRLYRLELLPFPNNTSTFFFNTQSNYPQPSAESDTRIEESPEHFLTVKFPEWDKPKTIAKIRSLSGYKAAIEKASELIEMGRREGVFMHFELFSILISILEFELRKNKIFTGVIRGISKASRS